MNSRKKQWRGIDGLQRIVKCMVPVGTSLVRSDIDCLSKIKQPGAVLWLGK